MGGKQASLAEEPLRKTIKGKNLSGLKSSKRGWTGLRKREEGIRSRKGEGKRKFRWDPELTQRTDRRGGG